MFRPAFLESYIYQKLTDDKRFNWEPTPANIRKMRNRSIVLAVVMYLMAYVFSFFIDSARFSVSALLFFGACFFTYIAYAGLLQAAYSKKAKDLLQNYELTTEEYDLELDVRLTVFASFLTRMPLLILLLPFAIIPFCPPMTADDWWWFFCIDPPRT